MDFSTDQNDHRLLAAPTTRDQAHNILLDRSEVYRSVVSRSLQIEQLLLEAARSLADRRRVGFRDPRWGDEQHDKLFKLPGVRRRKSLSHQPFCFNICMSLLYHLAPLDVKPKILIFLNELIALDVDLHSVAVTDYRDVTKGLTTSVKHSNARLGIGLEWVWFSDWDQFCGFNVAVPLSPEEVNQKVFDWCKGPINRPLTDADDDLKDYGELFYRKSVALLDFLARCEGDAADFKDWALKTDLWVTSGSSRGVRLSIKDSVTGSSIASKNSKAVFPQSMTSAEVAALMVSANDEEPYSVAEKVEPGQKGRLIISAPLGQQLRMSYVEHYIRPYLSALNGKTTMFMNSERIKKFFDETIQSCQDVTGIHVPLDVSGFDHSVIPLEINALFDAMAYNLSTCRISNKWRLLLMLNLAKKGWFNIPVHFKNKFICYWERGVPSGVKWTSLFDTLVGIVRMEVCIEQLGRDSLFGKPIISRKYFQGDDMLLVVRRLADIVRIINWFNSMNIDVSPVKNFMSFEYDEFLRKVYYRGGMTGYAARRLVKLCFRDPLKAGPPDRLTSARSTATSLWSLIWRGADYDAIQEMILYSVKKNFAVSKWVGAPPDDNEIIRWLTTLPCLGGCGLEFKGVVIRSRPVAIEIIYTGITPSERYSIQLRNLNLERIRKIVSITGYNGNFDGFAKSTALSLAPEPPRVIYKLKKVFPVFERTRLKISNLTIFSRSDNFWRAWAPAESIMHLPYQDIISAACSADNVDVLRALSSDACHKLFDTIKHRCHPSVLYHWVRGSLPSVSANLRDTNEVVSSVYCDRIVSQGLTNLLKSKNNITYSDFVNALVLINEHVYTSVVGARRANLTVFYGS